MPGPPGSSPMLLSEYARQTGSLAMKFVDSVMQTPNLLTKFQFVTDPSLDKTITQIKNSGLGTVNWSKPNEQAAPTRHSTRNVPGSIHFIADYIQADKRLIRAWRKNKGSMPDPVEQAFDAYTAAKNIDVNTKLFLNNQVSGDPDAPLGFWYQLQSAATLADNYLSDQMLLNPSVIDLTPTNGTAANAMKAVEQWDKMMFRMGAKGKKSVKIVCDSELLRRMKTLLGIGRIFSESQNQFDQTITMYNGAEIIEMGYQSDGSTPIISIAENVGGTALTGDKHTSTYIIDTDPKRLFCWQDKVMEPEALPDEGIFKQWMMDWGFGYLYANDRTIGRITGFKVQD